MEKAKKKRNVIAYVISFLIVSTSRLCRNLWVRSRWVVLASIPVAFDGEGWESVFGGVSGDMIGATNEIARAVTLILLAGVLMLYESSCFDYGWRKRQAYGFAC